MLVPGGTLPGKNVWGALLLPALLPPLGLGLGVIPKFVVPDTFGSNGQRETSPAGLQKPLRHVPSPLPPSLFWHSDDNVHFVHAGPTPCVRADDPRLASMAATTAM